MENYEIINNNLETSLKICIEKFFDKRSGKIASNISKKIMKYAKSESCDANYQYSCPLQVTWKIVSSCNLRCAHCFFQGNEDKYNSSDDLSTDKIMQVIDELAEMNVVSIILTGGEVLLTKNILKILEKIKSKNIAVSISTNATLVSSELAQKLGTILNPVMDNIQVSLDGATRETNDKIRGKGAFDRAVQGIKNLVSAGIPPSINCTATTINIHELPLLYELAQDLKVKKISIYKIVPFWDEQNNLVPSLENLFKAVSEVIRLENPQVGPVFDNRTFTLHDFVNYEPAKKIISEYLNFSEKQREDIIKDCMCHNHDKVYIDSNGTLYLCNSVAQDEKNSFGNINYGSFAEVWANRFQNEFYKERNLSSMACKKCPYVCICRGGCPANAYEEYHTINAPDGNCNLGCFLMQCER